MNLDTNHHPANIQNPEMANDLSQDFAEEYRRAIEQTSNGPQAEGVDVETVAYLLRTAPENTIYLEHHSKKVPVFFNTAHVDVMSKDYMVSRYGKDATDVSLYFSPTIEGDVDVYDQVAELLAERVGDTTTAILYEEQEGYEWKSALLRQLLARAGLSYVEDKLIDPKNNSEAAIIHYSGLASPEDVGGSNFTRLRDVFERYYNPDINSVQNGVTFLDSETFQNSPAMQDYIWNLCNAQFTKVVENLPVRQSPTKEELVSMLAHPDTSTVMYVEEGIPITLCVFAHSIDACEWLRKPYFDKYDNEWLGYYAFLVTDENRLGERRSHDVLSTIIDLVKLSKQDLRVVFECTNISADYIPYGIVEPVINSSGKLKIQLKEVARYIVKSVIVNPQNSSTTSQ